MSATTRIATPSTFLMRVRPRLLFFFSSRRRHTRCGRDWSSDVCSSDLQGGGQGAVHVLPAVVGGVIRLPGQNGLLRRLLEAERHRLIDQPVQPYVLDNGFSQGVAIEEHKIGRASCRERVEISVVTVLFR